MDQPLANVRSEGDLAFIEFLPREKLYASDNRAMIGFWNLLSESQIERKKAILFRLPKDFFAPKLVDEYWQEAARAAPEPTPYGAQYRPRLVGTTDTTIRRTIEYLGNLPAFTVGVVEGQVDFDLMGLMMACDYRIASSDTVFVNNTLKRSSPPGTAAPWFLTRLIGYAKTREIYLEQQSLSAQQAREHHIVDVVVDPGFLDQEATEIAIKYGSFDRRALKSLTRALDLTTLELMDYLEKNSSGFLI